MSRRRATCIHRFAFGRDLLDDPLNVGWDAVVHPERTISPEVDPDDVAFLRRFHALEVVSLPSPAFFSDLEQQLVGLYPPPVASPRIAPQARPPRWSGIAPWAPKRPGAPSRTHRLFSMQGALAIMAIVMVAGLLVLYQTVPRSSEPPAIPAAVIPKPELQTLVQFDFDPPMWGMPDGTTWTHMDFSIIELAPGKSFTTETGFYTSTDGPLVLMVLSGELTIQPVGPAQFFSATQPHHPPVDVAPGSTVSLNPNEAIVYSVADTAKGSNPGNVPMTALIGLTGSAHLVTDDIFPSDVSSLDFHFVDGMDLLPTNGATVSLQRLELKPFDSFVFDPGPNWNYLPVADPNLAVGVRIAGGALDGLSSDVPSRGVFSSSSLSYLSPGPHTLFNLGEETVDFYFFVVEPASAPGTPVS